MTTSKKRYVISASTIIDYRQVHGVGLTESLKAMRKHNLVLDAIEAESFQALKRVVIELARAL